MTHPDPEARARELAQDVYSRVQQRNITNDERREIIADALRKAEARGYLRGIKAAARVCDENHKLDIEWGFEGPSAVCADKVRALAKQGGKP